MVATKRGPECSGTSNVSIIRVVKSILATIVGSSIAPHWALIRRRRQQADIQPVTSMNALARRTAR